MRDRKILGRKVVPYFSVPYFSVPYFSVPYFSVPYFSVPYFSVPYFSVCWVLVAETMIEAAVTCATRNDHDPGDHASLDICHGWIDLTSDRGAGALANPACHHPAVSGAHRLRFCAAH